MCVRFVLGTQNMENLSLLSEPAIYLSVFAIIFSETGILACFFLPGDSLLFSLGLFAQQGIISLPTVILVLALAGFFGNLLGYQIGKFLRDKHHKTKFLKRIPDKHIEKTERFYKIHGSWTVVLARFVPVVRTVAPFLAGVSKMNYRKFVALSLLGAIFWASIVTSAGFFFGSMFDVSYVVYVGLGLMILASVLTPILLFWAKKHFQKN